MSYLDKFNNVGSSTGYSTGSGIGFGLARVADVLVDLGKMLNKDRTADKLVIELQEEKIKEFEDHLKKGHPLDFSISKDEQIEILKSEIDDLRRQLVDAMPDIRPSLLTQKKVEEELTYLFRQFKNKYVRITLPDASTWDIHVGHVAMHRANFSKLLYDNNIQKALVDDTIPFFEEDNERFLEWVSTEITPLELRNNVLSCGKKLPEIESWVDYDITLIDEEK